MEEINSSNISESIAKKVTENDSVVRNIFMGHFKSQIDDFIKAMSCAYINWQEFDSTIGTDIKKTYISALIFHAINNHIISMNIFLSGYIIAAGNLQRQVIETIALAFLCSGSSLDVLERFMKDKYFTNKAVDDVLENHKVLNLNKDALKVLKRSQKFYHQYSHPSLLSLASLISFSNERKLFSGASFDEGKKKQYTIEVNSIVSLANTFNNFIEGIRSNVYKW